MNRKKQRRIRKEIDKRIKDNSHLFGKPSPERERADLDRDRATARELYEEFRSLLNAAPRTRDEVIERFALFKKELQKRIHNKRYLRETFEILERAKANFLFTCSVPSKQKPEAN